MGARAVGKMVELWGGGWDYRLVDVWVGGLASRWAQILVPARVAKMASWWDFYLVEMSVVGLVETLGDFEAGQLVGLLVLIKEFDSVGLMVDLTEHSLAVSLAMTKVVMLAVLLVGRWVGKSVDEMVDMKVIQLVDWKVVRLVEVTVGGSVAYRALL